MREVLRRLRFLFSDMASANMHTTTTEQPSDQSPDKGGKVRRGAPHRKKSWRVHDNRFKERVGARVDNEECARTERDRWRIRYHRVAIIKTRI